MASTSEPTPLEARISKPEDTIAKPAIEDSVSKTVSAAKPESTDLDKSESKGSIAVNGDMAKSAGDTTKSDRHVAQTIDKPDDGALSKAQIDGASGLFGGTGGIYEPDYDVEIKLSDVQADPSNPLFSIKSFNELGLPENVLKGIYQMRFTKPSKIQERALPLLLSNPPMNLIGQSQSGTGKTAAFVLNILTRLDSSTPEMCRTPQALCLAPTRELARQILGVIQIMGQFVPSLTTAAAIPTDQENRGKRIEAQVIVGTPGTTTDLIRKRLIDPTRIKVLVLDEADNMLEQQGLGEQSLRVKQILPRNIQIVLFSATFPDKVVAYAARFAGNANQITLKHEELTVDGIKQLYLDCANPEDKYDSLVRLYGLMTIGSSIIFVKTRETALQIEKRMNEEGHKVACLTGQFEGYQRDIIIDSFRNGSTKVLITTNVLARGIDVQTVSLVVNYDVPMYQNGHGDPQTYLHRIGRTGRFGRVGVSICMLCGTHDWTALKEISDYFCVEMTGLDTNDWDSIETTVKRIIKSTRAEPGYNMKSGEIQM